MLNNNRLPLYVLKTILLYLVDDYFDCLEDWKELVPLVGVCKKWTRILHPVVFSTAYIDYNEFKKHRWATNVDCISIRGWYNNVKTMNICIIYPGDDMLVLKQLQSILELDTINWTGISRLVIDLNFDEFSCVNNYLGDLDVHVVNFARKLISKMPNIISLRIYQYEDTVFRQLLVLLVNAYSAQLRLLDMKPIINNPTTHLGSNLTYLTLGFDDDIFMKYKKTICAEPLCELCMTNVPVEIPWHIFHGYSDPGHINFKSLQKLSILYNIADVENQSNTQLTHLPGSTDYIISTSNANYTYKLLFPKLRELTIHNCPNNVNSFNAKFGGAPKIVKLLGTLQCILKCVTILQSIPNLEMSFDADGSLTATEHINMLNELLDVTARHQYRILNLDYISTKLSLSSIAWGNINELTFTEVDITDVLTLLSKTPRLENLAVHYIDIDDYDTIDKVEQLFQQRVDTRPFALFLKALVIYRIYNEYNNNIALAVIYNLMTRAKLLFEIAVPEMFVNRAMMITDVQKDYYPHFSKMRVYNIENIAISPYFD